MQPRLSSSLKWTALPEELVNQLRSVFSTSFKEHLGTSSIAVQGRIYPREILMRVSLIPQQGLKQSGFNVSIDYQREKDNVMKLVHLAVDAFGSLFEQFFAAENDQEFPRLWQPVDFEGRQIYILYTTENTQLEAEANRLLGLPETTDLAQGDWDDDITAEQIKASLGIDSEDDDGSS